MLNIERKDAIGYRAIGLHNVERMNEWKLLSPEMQEAVRVVGQILPFKTNRYVIDRLINWDNVPSDPIFQLTFPQRGMLSTEDYDQIASLLHCGFSRQQELIELTANIRSRLNPHPSGQLTHNVPTVDDQRFYGLQHKYRETVLFFPAKGQTCHAYCTYCFRWAQFIGEPSMKFEAHGSSQLFTYLRHNSNVTDVLVTGGDPMIMRGQALKMYLEPLLMPEFEHITSIRIGTKSLAYWPYRYTSDTDASNVLKFFEQIVRSGKHLAIMAHFTHPVELSTDIVQQAISHIRSTGAVIRMQAPLVNHVNADPEIWALLWSTGVKLGLVPYYMFVERDTGPRNYFEVPLVHAYNVFRDAYKQVTGLARTVRGPCMSTYSGKAMLQGIQEVNGQRVFLLEFIQARNPDWVKRPFFAVYDDKATWLSELKPAFETDRFFFEVER